MSDKRPPVAALDGSCVWSPTADAAAMAVLAKLPPGKREQAGAIYTQQGPDGLAQFCYSLPVDGKQDNFAFETEKGRHLAGLWHTHPGDSSEAPADIFSPNDVAIADRLRRPSYVRVNETGNVIKYAPGETPTTTYETSNKLRNAKASKGTPVGNVTRRDDIVAAWDQNTPK